MLLNEGLPRHPGLSGSSLTAPALLPAGMQRGHERGSEATWEMKLCFIFNAGLVPATLLTRAPVYFLPPLKSKS